MSTTQRCPQCGNEFAADSPGGLCPACLLSQGRYSGSVEGSVQRTVLFSGFVPPDPVDLQRQFPHLEILELLGKGGMGAVYKARQNELGRLVAVKILPPEVGRDPAFAERFSREAKALAQLHHQSIVSVYDFGRTHDLYYFVMEYVDGTNLRDLIRGGKLTPDQALGIVPQICEALQFAHDEGIVHRDIKPENILVDKRGRVKIADFGLAKLVGQTGDQASLTQTNQVMGTLHYMAPEQMAGAKGIDHRADIYSLGVVIYEMLTGELPIGRFEVPSKKVHVDLRIDEVVLRTLESRPERRFQHVSDLKSELDTIRGVSPIARDKIFGREFRSKRTVFGIPLVHIATGIDPTTGKSRIARGIIAIGDRAVGLIAMGGMAFGGIAFGGVAGGLFSVGGLSIAILGAVGGLALGGVAFGGMAIGVISLGGGAVGLYAFGGAAWGLHTLSGMGEDPEAARFFFPWAANWWKWLTGISILSPVASGFVWLIIWFMFRKQALAEAGGQQT
ncbi:MAG TPA: protein kinase [Planctomycetaceae bacterium]|jgi:tRNA A-37 threonylcarbamoyl transferase component Bud32